MCFVALNRLAREVRLRSSIFRAPRLEIFLSSLQSGFFSNLLGLSYRKKFLKLQAVFPGEGR
jgi:hypothetical protein